ncbi:MAG: hypothetical protein U5K72_18580 [Balneolaceae bacterium]|nr:hypothetical protein [Balneolaceae bacterium]
MRKFTSQKWDKSTTALDSKVALIFKQTTYSIGIGIFFEYMPS